MGLTSSPVAPWAEPVLPVTAAGASFRVHASDARRAYWARVASGTWEPLTYEAVNRFLIPSSVCIDIGAWIGPITLHAARRGARVHAVEPDPVAFEELAANIAANPDLRDRVVLHPMCISPERGPVTLYAGGMYACAQSRFGDSMSGLLAGTGAQVSCQVEGVPLEEFMAEHAHTGCSLIKMDVEGGEFRLIPGRWRRLTEFGLPTLLVSFHAPPPAQRRELFGACLEELRTSYRFLTALLDRAPLDVDRALADVHDWCDEEPGSAWRVFDYRMGLGVLASSETW